MQKLLDSLGPVCAIIGAQWGDEGKGKIVDVLAAHYDVIARACGGANAGHTIVVGGKKHVFHLLPAGSLHEGKPVLLGAGMVIHLPTLLEEIHTLEAAGISIRDRLGIMRSAHILLNYHKQIDGAIEEGRGSKKIGTTKRGIGPAYMDKAARTGLRMDALLLSEDELRSEIAHRAGAVERMYGISVSVDEELSCLLEAKEQLHECLTTMDVIYEFLYTKKSSILIEGAQAALLDIDHGTYPYVTSSSTTAAGALQGLGLPPKALTSCIGVAKAYCTRVGEGTFPTEEKGERGDRLRERGGEYGATTGRPRRCGWLHIPSLNYASLLNGFSCWCITKLDVLDEEPEIPVGLTQDAKGNTPYENFPGWKSKTAGIHSYTDLPENARKFIRSIEERTHIPVNFIGTGPNREDLIVRE
ncbi:MAG: adenylosuccinate synthase [Candidatus Peregrinibacteria bacterium]|nr:adenylosuccinate synthase [Candidatus Peregrinibacteria bacterium]